MTEIGLVGAFLGGLLSLLSPCSALLLPSFFAYAFNGISRLVARTSVFYAGLCVTLVPLGAAAGLFGALLTSYRDTVTLAGGLVLVGLGLLQISGRGFGISAAQQLTGRIRVSSNLSVFALGAVYGLAGFCAGPLLGSVLTVSATGGDPLYGAVLLAVFALGMAFPLFVLAVLWDRFDIRNRKWLRGREIGVGRLRVHTANLVSGLVFVAIGVLFVVTDGTANLGGLADVDGQFAVQVWLRRAVAGVTDAQVLLVVAVVALVAVLWRIRHVERKADQDAEREPADRE
ncbi:cytochrome c biogenesis CcdA family protein [Saccharopolyspora erythraea]|uniref:cytochrome c biogenesis CcdA family protein n=1 Tax=Saccharopolyspora erythraea TaxID=1836 RepID=UPI00038D9DCB|nr:cytochrome c biogenesis CcdA family protein [Saccharopolyspora erythraea]EQD83597.1 thiol-disulfide oxidoreductase [Saccharopolyspora erythraea D]QRK90602.1 cytochrome c biogenesis protein CcdA [Saccharopolyspora erythraea]